LQKNKTEGRVPQKTLLGPGLEPENPRGVRLPASEDANQQVANEVETDVDESRTEVPHQTLGLKAVFIEDAIKSILIFLFSLDSFLEEPITR
jgi:hypothetical protein